MIPLGIKLYIMTKKYFEKQNNFFVPVCFQQIARLLMREHQAILENKWDRKRTLQANVRFFF